MSGTQRRKCIHDDSQSNVHKSLAARRGGYEQRTRTETNFRVETRKHLADAKKWMESKMVWSTRHYIYAWLSSRLPTSALKRTRIPAT